MAAFMILAIVTTVTGVSGWLLTGDMQHKGNRVGVEFAPLGDAAMEIKLTATTAHLIFEEIMGGDAAEDIEVVWELLDDALFYCDAISKGGANDEGTFIASVDHEVLEKMAEVRKDIMEFRESAETRHNMMRSGGVAGGVGSAADERFDALFDSFMQDADAVETMIHHDMELELEALNKSGNKAQIIMISITIFAFILAVILGLMVTNSIIKPLFEVKDVASDVADGNLEVSVDVKSKDEIGELGQVINQMIVSLKQNNDEMQANLDMGAAVVEEVKRVSRVVGAEGDIEERPNLDIATGQYHEMLVAYSEFIDGFVGDMLEVISGATSYAEGNFDFIAKKLPGKKIVLTDAFNKLRNNILELIKEGVRISDAAKNGDLKARGDVDKFHGGYKDIIAGINSTIENILQPIDESVRSLESIADGNLTLGVDGDYKGDHANIKNAINNSLEALNGLLTQVNTTSDQVSAGAHQVSDSSQSLSQGATEQASSLEEISASMTEIGSQTKVNADNAQQASDIADAAREAADKGNAQMQTMLESMNGINDSSREISRIIKVIDEIAFQTNLLALNAAVEAARAGQHGKGFAVVAEEVRNLAKRSASAASETTELIEGSNKRVETGVQIANGTAEALGEIVGSISKVSDLVSEIAEASKEQSMSTDQISTALQQVDSVTQGNTANAEESAAAAEELSSQSAYLKQMLTKFVLGQVGSNSGRSAIMLETKQQNVQTSSSNVVRPDNVISLDDEDFLNF
jgi:methyl-accepting chemotaxis protein